MAEKVVALFGKGPTGVHMASVSSLTARRAASSSTRA
jgi:hypothetical protein